VAPHAGALRAIGDRLLDLGFGRHLHRGMDLARMGSKTSPRRPEAALTSLPPMKWPMSRMPISLSALPAPP